jgi:hypothetical protein
LGGLLRSCSHLQQRSCLGSILRSLLLSAHKREEEERGEQRKKRHEKGHDRSMFLNQGIQILYRSHNAAPSKPEVDWGRGLGVNAS